MPYVEPSVPDYFLSALIDVVCAKDLFIDNLWGHSEVSVINSILCETLVQEQSVINSILCETLVQEQFGTTQKCCA